MKGVSSHSKLWFVFLAILLTALVVILLFAKPAAPRRITLYAGPDGGTYDAYAQKYSAYLADGGIQVDIVKTSGSIENLRALAEREEPAAAFALSGVEKVLDPADDFDVLESLGCLSFQPFWLFVREDSGVTEAVELAGLKVALGPTKHDGWAIATLVLTANEVDDKIVEPEISEQEPEAVAATLVRGDLDAAFFVGSPHSAAISTLLEADGVTPVSFRRVDAFSRLYPALGQVKVPEGLFDLARDIPDVDLQLMAPADNLVVRSDLHPVVVDLLLDAAKSIHREPTLFADRGTFPNMRYVSLPLSDAAVRFHEEGPSPWRKYLPYWLATLISRFALIVAQVGAVVVVFFKGIPALMKTRFNMKSLDLYKRMMTLEHELMAGAGWQESVAALDEIRNETASLKVPRFLLTDYLELCQNAHDVRERMEGWHETHPDSE